MSKKRMRRIFIIPRTREFSQEPSTLGKSDVIIKIVNTATAFLVALATAIGSYQVPKLINTQTINATKISELSRMVPNIYKDSTSDNNLRASIIAMTAHGETSVPILLMILEDVIRNEDNVEKQKKTIDLLRSAMSYIGEDVLPITLDKLALEIQKLNFSKDEGEGEKENQRLMRELSSILEENGICNQPKPWIGGSLLKDYEIIISSYFKKVSDKKNFSLQPYNTILLTALEKCRTPLNKLALSKVYFDEESDFFGYRFDGANLTGSDFRNCILIKASFHQSKFDSTTDFRGAKLVSDNSSPEEQIKRLIELKSWGLRECLIDKKLRYLLDLVSKETIDKDKVKVGIVQYLDRP